MFSIINILTFIKSYGTSGVIIFLLALCLWALHKLATNHLHHIDLKLDEIIVDVLEVKTDVKEIKDENVKDKQRISKIEGMLS